MTLTQHTNFDAKDSQACFTNTRDYVMRGNPVMDPLLKLAEDHDDLEVLTSDSAGLLQELGMMTNLEPMVASSGMCSFMNAFR